MAAKVIETKAIISAQDRTGATFATVAQKLRKMEDTAKSANRGVAAATKAGVLAQSVSSKAYLAAGAAMRVSGLSTFVNGAATALAGGAAAHEVMRASSERIHETLRMQASGMSAREIQNAMFESARLAKEFPAVRQVDIAHMLRNARSIVGSFEEANEIMEPLLKLRLIAQANRPGQDVSEDFDQLVKGLEIKGVTQHPEQFRQYMEGIAKGLNMFGDTLKPYQYYEMFKYGRQATPGLSERFILTTAPTLAQELGGSSYGKAVSAFNASIVGNVMKHSAIKDFVKLGLVDSKDVKELKSGEYKFEPGGHVKGWRLAQSDPNEWVKQYLIPALQRAGITHKEEVLARISALFQNQMASQLVGILATQQSRIDKDAHLWGGAKGMAAAYDYQSKDPAIAWQGLKNAGEGLAARLGESFGHALAPEMNNLAKAIAGYTERIARTDRERAQHPGELTTQERKFNRIMNAMVYGVDSDQPGFMVTAAEKQEAKVTDELARLRGSPARLAKVKAWRAANKVDGFFDRVGQWAAGATDHDLDNSENDLRRYRALHFAHRRKLRAQGALARFMNYAQSIREFEDRVDTRAPIALPGIVAFPMTGASNFGSVPHVVSGGVGVRPGMRLPAWMGVAGAGQQKQAVDVHVSADPLEVKNTVIAEAGTELIRFIEATKQTLSRIEMKVNASGPGSTGAPDFRSQ